MKNDAWISAGFLTLVAAALVAIWIGAGSLSAQDLGVVEADTDAIGAGGAAGEPWSSLGGQLNILDGTNTGLQRDVGEMGGWPETEMPTLRDWFAGQAMQEAFIMAIATHDKPWERPDTFDFDEVATFSYRMADAMIEAKEKP